MSERHERHPDLFTPDEAAAYLRLADVRALEKLRAKRILRGHSGWAIHMLYHRADLDKCALRMCGIDKSTEALDGDLRLAQ